jgi:hypothetical protein
MDAYAELIGKTLRIENADNSILNVVDVATGTRYWIESTGTLLVFKLDRKTQEGEPHE